MTVLAAVTGVVASLPFLLVMLVVRVVLLVVGLVCIALDDGTVVPDVDSLWSGMVFRPDPVTGDGVGVALLVSLVYAWLLVVWLRHRYESGKPLLPGRRHGRGER